MSDQLLSTKLYLPPPKPGFVPRPRLVEKLDQAIAQGCRLILVSAPAGYGKTTLIAEWAEKGKAKGEGIKDKENLYPLSLRPLPLFAWVSLDPDDNDPVLFWSYVLAALQPAAPELRLAAEVYLQSPQSLSTRPFLTLVINQLAALPTPLVLVLDDYHLIADAGIQQGMDYLVDHLPANVHLVLLTRADPALPLARLRARGQALVLRADDLRFLSGEVALLLGQFTGVSLSTEEIAAIEARTEGWIVGLQMAALALESLAATRGRDAVANFIQSFGGSQRYILDYLLEEVLDRQPEHVQSFLLQTSILDRMCASLVDAVIVSRESRIENRPPDDAASDDSRLSILDSRSTLEHLERMNLFLLPLDDQRKWYRYHHLFADLLRARLRQVWPERIPELHRRAARWFEEKALLTEAVGHALAAGAADTAARLIEQHTIALLDRGELHTLLRWIKALPEGMAAQRPWLAIYQAWALTLAGRLEDAVRLLERIETQLEPTGDAAGSVSDQALRGQTAAIRAYHAGVTGRVAEALDHARQAHDHLPAQAVWTRNIAEWARGYAFRTAGKPNEAAASFAEVVRTGYAMNDLLAVASGTFDLAMTRRLQGDLREAERLFVELLEYAGQRRAGGLGYLGRSHAGLASVLYEQNRLEEAYRHVLRSQELNEDWHNPNHDLFTAIVMARIHLARGDLAGTEQALNTAREVARKFPVTPLLTSQIDIIQVRLWLRRGELDNAVRWAETREPNLSDPPGSESQWAEALTLIRIWVAQQHAQPGSATDAIKAAEPFLERLFAASQALGQTSAAIEILTLKALALHGLGQTAEALAAFENALRLAGPGGFFRVIVDEGEPVKDLLLAARGKLKGASLVYASRLLSAFQPDETGRPGQPALVEPLTEREIEILRLLEKGLSNPEIAAKLVLAEGTVKAHVANIMRKLDVHNRTQAVSTARELGILP